jgi:hypothetical protein
MKTRKSYEDIVYDRYSAAKAVLPSLPQETGEQAKVASLHAIAEAIYNADLGYDFGFCSPGSIDKVVDGYEVCFP